MTKIESEIEVIGTVVSSQPMGYTGMHAHTKLDPNFLIDFNAADPEGNFIKKSRDPIINVLKDSLKGTPVKINSEKFSNLIEVEKKELRGGMGKELTFTDFINEDLSKITDDYVNSKPSKEGKRYVAVAMTIPTIVLVGNNFPPSIYHSFFFDIYEYTTKNGETKKSLFYRKFNYDLYSYIKVSGSLEGTVHLEVMDKDQLKDSINHNSLKILEKIGKMLKKDFQ